MEAQVTRRLGFWIFAVLGWVLSGAILWYEHRPQPPAEVPPETAKALDAAGFTEGTVSTLPPVKVIRETVKIPGAERLVYVEVAAPPIEAKAPDVRVVPGNCVQGAPQAANWTLRPGDLSLRDGFLDIRKVGRHGFVRFEATLSAQTPEGEVSRTVQPKTDAWLSTKALGIPPRFGPTFRGTVNLTKLELRSLEAGVYWTRGRLQQDATVGRDLSGDDWFAGYGVRF
jgi:hypothetical protein